MFGSVVVIFCLLSTITASLKLGAENFNNNWVPLNLTQSSYDNRSVQETLENLLKKTQHPQNINIDLVRANAIRLVKPPAKPQKKITFYFSTPNINEDIDFSALENKQEFNGFGDTFKSEVPSQPIKTENNITSDFIETNAEPEKTKSNSIDYSEINEFPKFVNNTGAPDKIHSTELPFNVTVSTSTGTSKYFDSSELPDIDRINTSEALNKNHQRTSKQMDSKYLVSDIMNLGLIKEAESSTYLISVKEKYVTEPTTTTTTTEATEETIEVKKGYFYKQPVVVPLALAADRNALTSKLLGNLAKYNIKVDDVLSNYDESKFRINNHDNTFRKTFHPQIPSMSYIPFKYNSLNHLPLNPLLAAFLSNYGFYLRGAFGRPNDYKNLYGYSASNNIHNNKPFGSYKVFSDTDSST